MAVFTTVGEGLLHCRRHGGALREVPSWDTSPSYHNLLCSTFNIQHTIKYDKFDLVCGPRACLHECLFGPGYANLGARLMNTTMTGTRPRVASCATSGATHTVAQTAQPARQGKPITTLLPTPRAYDAPPEHAASTPGLCVCTWARPLPEISSSEDSWFMPQFKQPHLDLKNRGQNSIAWTRRMESTRSATVQ